MVKSMTAFARAEMQGEWGVLSAELRSVNHRYLDISLRLPDELRAIEGRMRELLRSALGRGKVECAFRYQAPMMDQVGIEVDLDKVRSLLRAGAEVERLTGVHSQYPTMDVMRWPGVVREPQRDLGAVQSQALGMLQELIGDFVVTREAEGARLAKMLRQRADAIAAQLDALRAHRKNWRAGLMDKYRKRLAEFEMEVDSGRLEQELALLVQRLDVDEELDRLGSHLAELHAILDRQEPIGRRLDFLMQEFNREANTLSAKSADIETTQAAIEIKVLIEQMREQVQNIE